LTPAHQVRVALDDFRGSLCEFERVQRFLLNRTCAENRPFTQAESEKLDRLAVDVQHSLKELLRA